MTHPLPPDTVNISINVSRAERAVLGRLASMRDVSVSRLVRDLSLHGMASEDPTAASAIAAIRRCRRASVPTEKASA